PFRAFGAKVLLEGEISVGKTDAYLSLLKFPSLLRQRSIVNFNAYKALLENLLITAFRYNQQSLDD
ncbi:MAG: hypothetical protein AAF599_10850, partial [Bacteroidota bacterium]